MTTVTISDGELFIDKYKPKHLDDLDFNFQLTRYLKNLSMSNDIPHMILRGIRGSGKKTRALLFLKEKLGPGVMSIKSQIIELKYPNKTIELQLMYSNYHYQINPSLHGVYDRLIIQDFIKDMIQYKSVGKTPYRIIIIEDADKLTYEAQQSLRRTLEKYVYICRFIFLISQEGCLIDALQSRCISLRVSAASADEINDILVDIAEREEIELTQKALDSIVLFSNQNLGRAINSLQVLALKSPEVLAQNRGVNLSQFSDIEVTITKIIKLIFQGGDLNDIVTFRDYLYDLLVHCVEPVDIIKDIFHHLLKAVPDSHFSFKYQIIKATDYYENTLRLGSKPIYHLEGYVIRLFHIIKELQKVLNKEKKKVIPKVIPPKVIPEVPPNVTPKTTDSTTVAEPETQ